MSREELIQSLTAGFEATKRALQAQFFRTIEQTGISISHAHLLMLIDQKQPVQLKDLASRMYLTPGAITQAIEAMSKDGYLTRKQDEQDRRSVYVTLTEKGQTTVNSIKQTLQARFTEMLTTLSDEELQLYLRAQQKMLEYLDTRTDSGAKGGAKLC